MRPAEILDAQGELIDRLKHDRDFFDQVAYMVGYQITTFTGQDDRKQRRLMEERRRNGMPGVQALAGFVEHAYAYRVTHDMSLMVQQAASELEGLDRFDASLAPTMWGFVRFDRPLPMTDVRGKGMLIHWLIWGPGQRKHLPGLTLWMFNDPWTQPDQVHAMFAASVYEDRREWYERMVGRWATIGFDLITTGQRMGPKTLQPSDMQRAEVLAEGEIPTPGTNATRYLHALFLLLNQTVTTVEDEYPDRAGKRRATRRGLPPKVSVIRLRRTKDSQRHEGESLVEWSHRWLSRAHWRWQPYGSRKADHQHILGPAMADEHGRTSVRYCQHIGCDHRTERIWVAGSVKGPADKPLVVSDKLYSLER